MSHKVQRQKPIRTCSKTYADYKSYKPHIAMDFNNRCGYCDTHDRFFGGKKNFQIDHFKPHSIAAFASLKHEYSNLVYSCQSCNNAKSNKWSAIDGFIDPCDPIYDNVISRDDSGKIKHNGTTQGEYIHTNLNFFLQRHELLWCIERLEEQRDIIDATLKNNTYANNYVELKLLREFHAIHRKIKTYMASLYKEISS